MNENCGLGEDRRETDPPIDDSIQNRHSEPGLHFRDAIRLLFILVAGCEAVPEALADSGAVGVFIGEKRAMACDFLVRYPDFLADALLDLYELEGDPLLLNAVKSIFEKDEPSVRMVRMLRWQRGAFQNIETALSILDSRRLIKSVRKSLIGGRKQYEFLVFPKASEFLDEAVILQPGLAWYKDRIALVMRVAGFQSGSALKEWQYTHKAYQEAQLGTYIPSIREDVKARLHAILENV